jgi:hypothetical protein
MTIHSIEFQWRDCYVTIYCLLYSNSHPHIFFFNKTHFFSFPASFSARGDSVLASLLEVPFGDASNHQKDLEPLYTLSLSSPLHPIFEYCHDAGDFGSHAVIV